LEEAVIAPLPEPRREGAASDDRVTISRRFIQQAREELEQGNRLQASEKTWGALAQVLKAIAQERNWWHRGHDNIVAAGEHIGFEYNHPGIVLATSEANMLHRNFYENFEDAEEVGHTIDLVESVLPDLEAIRYAPPRHFVISTPRQRRNVYLLTNNDNVKIGDESSVGFSLNHLPDPNGGI
jgi:hypothetical protein